MKQVIKISVIVLIILVVACNNSQKATAGQAISLPELKEGEENVFENDLFRLVDGGIVDTEDGVYNTFKVQPKNSSIATFEMKGTVLAFETVVGNALLVSEGTGMVRLLRIYDLTCGEGILEIDNFASEEFLVKNDNEFYYYVYDDDAPIVVWSKAKGGWQPENDVPQALLESEQLKKEAKHREESFDGMAMMAKQKMLVNISDKKITPQNERKWFYVE